ncbi:MULTISPECIES: ABC transporter permease [unclassified Paenibacillus]|uniref:ABC transporter permease n=1 Tax=unclassified Paenibacillus TaxID=185978 RepID=UPI001C1035AE|nr:MULTISPECIES: ABC transporter permease [unclassified Paenibacillus]MBU5441186.1 ABC transporter permease [Paenibacillus sp. MSJ-34]CAH0120489.1 Linearmycin resistance permease protein LnrN [Paenibacillus sp. CECT 9249]
MKAIIVKELKLIRKDKRSFFFLLLMPILFIVMFGTVFGVGSNDSFSIEIQAVDQDGTEASRAFLGQVGQAMTVSLEEAASLNDQIDRIKQGQFSAVLVIPSGFETAMKKGEVAGIQLYEDPAAQSSLAPIQAILNGISNEYREQKLSHALIAKGETKAQAEQTLASPIRIDHVPTSSERVDVIAQLVPGMTVMFVFFIMITMSRRFFEEKKNGLLARVRSTAVKPLQYLIGMWVPFVLTVIAQCVVLFAFGHFVYHLNLGDVAALAIIVAALSIAGTGIGLGLSFIVPGEGAAMVTTQLIATGGAMIGGLWMPSYLMPPFVQTIGHFTPQYWAQHSLQNVMAHGAHIGDVMGPVLVLLTFGLAGLAVAVVRLPGYMRSASN